MKAYLTIWIILAVAEMLRHCYIRKYKKRSPNKVVSFIGRSIAVVVLLYFEPRPLGESILTYTVIGWWIHDYPQNLILGVRPVWYLNSTGPVDRLQNKYPNAYVWFCWKSIALLGLLGIYFFNY